VPRKAKGRAGQGNRVKDGRRGALPLDPVKGEAFEIHLFQVWR
jgi:hypothetical protein